MRRERMLALFDDLQQSGELTPELLESEEFLHCFVAAATAAQRTAKREKIRLLASLLRNAVAGRIPKVATFEERLCILDELSPRELEALAIISYFEDAHPPKDPGQLGSTAAEYWSDLKGELSSRLSIPETEVTSFLQRLGRSGLYETLEGLWGGNVERLGRLTPAFVAFRTDITLEDRRLAWPFEGSETNEGARDSG